MSISIFQIRGSIPLLWEQIVDLSYKPRLRIINHEQTVQFLLQDGALSMLSLIMMCALYVCTLAFWLQSNVVERHFHDLLQRYGETVAVDLTDKVKVSSLSFFF